MPVWPCKFLHASDLHLERGLAGVAEVPEHLRELFLEAPYQAAERIFDAALAERVDFVVLSGDCLQPVETGPRGPLFLMKQFNRLAERGVAVYWAGGRVDPPNAWPASIKLPGNIHVFPEERMEERIHRRDDLSVARIIGKSHERRKVQPSDFPAEPADLFTVAVAYGSLAEATFKREGIHYWALGGKHASETFNAGGTPAHYPGTCQGRSPQQQGVHGCTLVEVDQRGRTHLRQIATDVARWRTERIELPHEVQPEYLRAELRRRIETLCTGGAGLPWLISWIIQGSGSLARELRFGSLAQQLLEWLRHDYGYRFPAAWSISLEAEPAPVDVRTWEPETLRGDYLRTASDLLAETDHDLDLSFYLEGPQDELLQQSAVVSGGERQRVLQQAAGLGLELLSGEGAQS